MSYNKTLFGNTVSVPEAGNSGVGPAATAILDDCIDGVDQSFTMVSGVVLPRRQSTTSVLAGAATLTQTHPLHRVSGSGGAVTLSGTTAIANGTIDGQWLILVGDHATNTVTIQNGANVQLTGGDVTLNQFEAITLEWNSTQGDWQEISRGGSRRLRNQAALELYELAANGTNKISLRAPASLVADLTYTLPSTIVNGGFLQVATDGSTSWGTASATTLDAAYDGGNAITVDTAAVTFNVSAAINGLRIFKSDFGSGNPLSIENDGTGVAAYIQQDGANRALDVTRASAGAIALFYNSGANSCHVEIQGDSLARQMSLGVVAGGNTYIGSASSHSFEIRTAGTAKETFDTSGNETLNTNNVYRKQVDSGATARNVIGINSSNALVVGDQGLSSEFFIAQGGMNSHRFFGSSSSGYFQQDGINGSAAILKWEQVSVATNSGTGSINAITIPAGVLLLSVTGRVTTAITGCASFDVGVSGTTQRFAAGVLVASGTTFKSGTQGTDANPRNYAASTNVVLTAVGGGAIFSTGVLRIVIKYLDFQAPTS